jgi:hypothetical protein
MGQERKSMVQRGTQLYVRFRKCIQTNIIGPLRNRLAGRNAQVHILHEAVADQVKRSTRQ